MVITSCPTPSAQAAIASIDAANARDPIAPAMTPRISQRVLPARCRVAAATIPTNKAASRVSRNTMSPVPNNMGLTPK